MREHFWNLGELSLNNNNTWFLYDSCYSSCPQRPNSFRMFTNLKTYTGKSDSEDEQWKLIWSKLSSARWKMKDTWLIALTPCTFNMLSIFNGVFKLNRYFFQCFFGNLKKIMLVFFHPDE